MTDDQDRIDDEIIFSISDDEANNNNDAQSSFTSISSKCTDYSSMMNDYSDLASAKVTKRKTGGRRRKNVATLTAEFEARDVNDGPLTRSRIKAQSSRTSIDGSQEVLSLPPTPQKHAIRTTRSMTRSPSPTSSVISTASTTVAHTIKQKSIIRRGSAIVKKPTKFLSPTNAREIKSIEEELNTTEGKRYNLRNRKSAAASYKDSDDSVEASTTPVKKTRKTVNRKNSLYKIDEASDNLIKQHKAESLKESENGFTFSYPHNLTIEKSNKNYDNDNENKGSFTFSPPQKSRKK